MTDIPHKKITHPAEMAFQAVESTMFKGTTRTDRPDWRHEEQDYHLDRAIRHICTYRVMRDGSQKPDGDNHLKLALTRLAMALAKDN